MKLQVILDKSSRFSIDLPEAQAADLYAHIIGMAMDELIDLDIEPILKVDEALKALQIPEEAVISDTTKEVKKLTKRLVITKCPNCNETAAMVLYVEAGKLVDNGKSLICRHCNNEIPKSELKYARYECPNCDGYSDFYVMGDIKEVNCRNCKSSIDMVWNEKKKQYMSANLLK